MMKSPESGSNPPTAEQTKNSETVRESVSKTDMTTVRNEGTMSATKSSSGPGGQNVNKTSKTAEFRWRPNDSQTFNARERQLVVKWMRENKPSQLVGDGEIYITNIEHKSLDGNKKAVMKILYQYLTEALTPPKDRVATKPTRGSKERRIEKKKQRAETKKQRSAVRDW